MAKIMSRAGKIMHLTMPKFKNSHIKKGFCFVEYSTPAEAKQAVEMFNSVVPNEFVNVNNPDFIVSHGELWAWKVMEKNAWKEFR